MALPDAGGGTVPPTSKKLWTMAELLELAQESEREIMEMRSDVTEGLLTMSGEALAMQHEILGLAGSTREAQDGLDVLKAEALAMRDEILEDCSPREVREDPDGVKAEVHQGKQEEAPGAPGHWKGGTQPLPGQA
uniref:Uncharacterized protein n=1 Tax=Alexandrium monilatum TaxID=311494 RepID=A0A7S4QRC6_9DINO